MVHVSFPVAGIRLLYIIFSFPVACRIWSLILDNWLEFTKLLMVVWLLYSWWCVMDLGLYGWVFGFVIYALLLFCVLWMYPLNLNMFFWTLRYVYLYIFLAYIWWYLIWVGIVLVGWPTKWNQISSWNSWFFWYPFADLGWYCSYNYGLLNLADKDLNFIICI